jgi:hypothetical protein
MRQQLELNMQRFRRFSAIFGLSLALAALSVESMQAQEVAPVGDSQTAPRQLEQSTNSNGAQPTSPEFFEAAGDRASRRLSEMGETLFRSMGAQIMQTLTRSGISQADSEEVARRYASEFGNCARSAFMIEAERQSISVNELLTRLAEVTYIGNVDLSEGSGFDPIQNVSKVMDFYSVNANLVSCVMGAMQDAGIPFEAGIEALPGPTGIAGPEE